MAGRKRKSTTTGNDDNDKKKKTSTELSVDASNAADTSLSNTSKLEPPESGESDTPAIGKNGEDSIIQEDTLNSPSTCEDNTLLDKADTSLEAVQDCPAVETAEDAACDLEEGAGAVVEELQDSVGRC